MTRATLTLAALIALADIAAPDTLTGYASAYAPGVMSDVIRYRFDAGLWPTPPPVGWYQAAGAIATMDCRQVGNMATLVVGGREWPVLVADCIGDGDPERFSRHNIIVEVDWQLWQKFTAAYGMPLEVQLR